MSNMHRARSFRSISDADPGLLWQPVWNRSSASRWKNFFFFCVFCSFRVSCRLGVCACSMYVLRVNSCKSFLPAAECAKQTDYRRPSMVHESVSAKYRGSVSEPDKRAIETSQT
ncbi:hypothetical protein M440DRAFT_214148 [Trichoderma longibrachiatum ATCC 18648]|uniref:Uncharacterized protein n=1 Tax=Trichoderma longibrachiatum ATCC 18648 TaxID=983965 RepID=A0A2T4BQ94_TRILO|nr:hypothetical protein M440DRAFT_214148 [Trichoderma longibrachiatum ATCC 18648]